MKTLYLIRHAKSDWSVETLPDIDRPLNNRGYTDAHAMSKRMKEKKIKPDLIISSPAIRAISTALIFSRNLGYDAGAIRISEQLYDTSVKDYLEVLRTIEKEQQTVFLFGHNPIITNCANTLTKSVAHEMPTCGIAGIKIHTEDWKTIDAELNALSLFDYPKNA